MQLLSRYNSTAHAHLCYFVHTGTALHKFTYQKLMSSLGRWHFGKLQQTHCINACCLLYNTAWHSYTEHCMGTFELTEACAFPSAKIVCFNWHYSCSFFEERKSALCLTVSQCLHVTCSLHHDPSQIQECFV